MMSSEELNLLMEVAQSRKPDKKQLSAEEMVLLQNTRMILEEAKALQPTYLEIFAAAGPAITARAGMLMYFDNPEQTIQLAELLGEFWTNAARIYQSDFEKGR